MSKMFAIAAAVFLVGAFALATLAPINLSLGQLLSRLDRDILGFLENTMRAARLPWLWDHAIIPMLVRPAWLLPTGLGLICVGGAATAGSNAATRGQRRRS